MYFLSIQQAADFYELYHVRDKLMREAYQHKTKRAIEYMYTKFYA